MIIGLNCELSCVKNIETGANAKDRENISQTVLTHHEQ